MTIKDPLFFSLYVHHHHFLQKPKTIFKAYLAVASPISENSKYYNILYCIIKVVKRRSN